MDKFDSSTKRGEIGKLLFLVFIVGPAFVLSYVGLVGLYGWIF